MLLETLISSLVPLLVSQAEALLGSKPDPQNHDWVVGLVNEVAHVLDRFLPDWVRPSEDVVKKLVEEAIEKGLEKVLD